MKFFTLMLVSLLVFAAATPSNSAPAPQEGDILDFMPAILAAVLNTDNDGDGYSEKEGDLSDTDVSIYPGAYDICGDGIDQDIDGVDRPCPQNNLDNDGDGYTVNQGDCDDTDASIYPGATEICGDGIDQNCSIENPCSEDYIDNDGDGYAEIITLGNGEEIPGDCDDNNPDVHPDPTDVCGDEIDNECTGGAQSECSNNLAYTSISILEPVTRSKSLVQIGHPFTVKLGIHANESTDNVAAGFFIVDKESYDTAAGSGAAPVTYYPIDDASFGTVSAGEKTYRAEIQISPTSPEYTEEHINEDGNLEPNEGTKPVPAGEYYLFAMLDPANEILETYLGDNRPTKANSNETLQQITVSADYIKFPDIVLEKIDVDINVFELFKPANEPDNLDNANCTQKPADPLNPLGDMIENIQNSHIGVTAWLNASGNYWPTYPDGQPGPIPELSFEGKINVLGNVIPVKFWDPVDEQYSNTLSVSGLEPGVPKSVHFDLRLFDVTDSNLIDTLFNSTNGIFNAATCLVGQCDLVDLGMCFLTHSQDFSCAYLDELLEDAVDIVYDLTSCLPFCYTPPPLACVSCATAILENPNTNSIFTNSNCTSCTGVTPDPVRLYNECMDAESLKICATTDDLNCIEGCIKHVANLEITVTSYDEEGETLPEYRGEFAINDDNIIDNIELNIITQPVPDEPPAAQVTTVPVKDQTYFNKGFSSKYLSVGFDALGESGLGNNGPYVKVEASMPVTLFGVKFDDDPAENPDFPSFFGFSMGASASAHTDSYGNIADPVDIDKNLVLKLFGINMYVELLPDDFNEFKAKFICQAIGGDDLSKWKIGGLDIVKSSCKDIKDQKALEDCVKGEFALGIYRKEEKNFVVGSVPLTAKVEAWGLAGFTAEIGFPCKHIFDVNYPAFEAFIGPWADVGMDVSGGVGNSKVLSAGLGGDVSLINETFYATAKVPELTFAENYVSGTLLMDVTNTLTGPSGSFYGYVGYPCVKVCNKLNIPYPCGTNQCKSTYDFLSFETWKREDVLFCKEQDVRVDW